MAEQVAIKVEGVSKDFKLPHQKERTLKATSLRALRPHRPYVEMQHALRNVSFEVKRGEFFGIVGRNGSGKSTLLKLLAGIYQSDRGAIQTDGRLVPFIELGVGFNPELSGRENVYLNGALLGFSKQEVDAMYDAVVEFAELEDFMDQKLKNYSSGMQVRLAFSLAIQAEADILLVDEVLAVGDADFQRKCFNYFRSLKKTHTTVVFVTHDMDAVREYCDRAILLDRSRVAMEGAPDVIAKEYMHLFNPTEPSAPVADSNRWGDGAVAFSDISVQLSGQGTAASVKVVCEAMAKEDIDEPIFGFAIVNAAGQPVLGTNTKIKKHKVGRLTAGDRVSVSWEFANILSDGAYTVDPAVVRRDGVTVCDWWTGAAELQVTKDERTPYVVTPHIEVETIKS